MPASPAHLLRLLRRAVPAPDEPVRVRGVDDWAKRKGKSYGTILVDLECHCPVDLLSDQKAESLAAWLTEHPGVEFIGRDRGGVYADGSRQGAAGTVQVADRFHVLVNLREALEQLLMRRHRCLQEAAVQLAAQERETDQDPQPEEGKSEPAAPRLNWHQLQFVARRERRVARYEEVRRLRAEGLSLRGICHATRLAFSIHEGETGHLVRGVG